MKVLHILMRILFSHLGLALMIIAYSIAGAGLYHHLEYPLEEKRIEKELNVSRQLDEYRERVKDLIISYKYEQKQEWDTMYELAEKDSKMKPHMRQNKYDINHYMRGMTYTEERIKRTIRYLLDSYHKNLSEALSERKSNKGTVETNTDAQWSIPSALVFAISAITLIGYGHVKPFSEMSRFLTVPYCLLGVPLCLIFLANIGKAMARFIRLIYSKICCHPCHKTRNKAAEDRKLVTEADRKMSEEITVPAINLPGLMAVPFDEEPSDILQEENDPVPLVLTLGIMTCYILFGAVVYHFWEKWSFVTSVYTAYTTLTTIGFGDYVPGFTTLATTSGKLKLVFGAVYIVVGLSVISMGFDLMIEEVMIRIHNFAIAVGIVTMKDEDGDGVDDVVQKKRAKMADFDRPMNRKMNTQK